VHEVFGKKPLSAPFDKLGNNASVAISNARRWSAQHQLKMVPFESASGEENVIVEVYPALAKSKAGEIAPSLAPFMSKETEPGTDAYDAAICAVTALAFAAGGRIEGLPAVCEPQSDSPGIVQEGWIFYIGDLSASSSP
jgi:hypothetical protein